MITSKNSLFTATHQARLWCLIFIFTGITMTSLMIWRRIRLSVRMSTFTKVKLHTIFFSLFFGCLCSNLQPWNGCGLRSKSHPDQLITIFGLQSQTCHPFRFHQSYSDFIRRIQIFPRNFVKFRYPDLIFRFFSLVIWYIFLNNNVLFGYRHWIF